MKEKKMPVRYVEIEGATETRKFRLTRQAEKDLEKSTGKKVMEFLETLDDDITGNFVQLLHASAKPFLENKEAFSLEDADNFYDDLIDAGKSIVDISEYALQILRQSGYVPTEQQMEEAQRKQVKDQLRYEDMLAEERAKYEAERDTKN